MGNFQDAIRSFDAYNSNDPNTTVVDGMVTAKEVLYARRMSEKLEEFAPHAPEHVKLAARCQHIGRWEVPRQSYPDGRKGYLQWRSTLMKLHAEKAESILLSCGYDHDTIDKVKFVLQKKQLHQHHPDSQVLEDVICLVFIQYYLNDFASKHDDEKVVDILRKTITKMSPQAQQAAVKIPLSPVINALMDRAKAP